MSGKTEECPSELIYSKVRFYPVFMQTVLENGTTHFSCEKLASTISWNKLFDGNHSVVDVTLPGSNCLIISQTFRIMDFASKVNQTNIKQAVIHCKAWPMLILGARVPISKTHWLKICYQTLVIVIVCKSIHNGDTIAISVKKIYGIQRWCLAFYFRFWHDSTRWSLPHTVVGTN